MASDDITITRGFSDGDRQRVAELFWEAFGPKMRPVLGSDETGIAFFAATLNPRMALIARRGEEIIGGAGLMTRKAHFITAGLGDFTSRFGVLSGFRRALLLMQLSNDTTRDGLTIDGLFVTSQARSLGIGAALLETARVLAQSQRKMRLRLYVIDTNTRALALYEHLGFTVTGRRNRRLFAQTFGFHYAYRMDRGVSVPMPQRSALTGSIYSD